MNLSNIEIPYRSQMMGNNFTGDLYLLDSEGYSHICNKDETNGDYVCSAIVNGKVILYDGNTYKECNINLNSNNIDYSSCKDIPYNYLLRNSNGTCTMSDLSGKEIYNSKNDDFPDQCCSSIYKCGTMGENNKESNNIYTKRYTTSSQQPKNKFACLKNAEQCVPFPNDYTKEKYPDINPDKVFDCNRCNCCPGMNFQFGNGVTRGGAAPNSAPNILDPTCKVCSLSNNPDYTPPEKVGRYTCDNGYCNQDDNGFYYDKDTCENSCGENKKNNKVIAMIIVVVVLLVILSVILSNLIKKKF